MAPKRMRNGDPVAAQRTPPSADPYGAAEQAGVIAGSANPEAASRNAGGRNGRCVAERHPENGRRGRQEIYITMADQKTAERQAAKRQKRWHGGR